MLKFDWMAFDAMTEEEVFANAMSDPDVSPYSNGPKVEMIKSDGRTVLERFRKAIKREKLKIADIC